MASKGISPMIAVVLLVAFTVAVGGIISLWMTNYATETTGSVETASENQTKCAGTYIDIVSVGTDIILISGRGTESINSITCYAGNGSWWGMGSLSPGEINSTKWDPTGTGGSYESGFGTVITCTGTCRNIGISSQCESGYSCWDM